MAECPPRTVAIVGGGVAGMTLAAALDPERFAVTVYEAAPERAVYGGAFAVWPAALRALERIGAREGVESAGHPHPTGALRDITGTTMLTLPSPGMTLVPRGRLLAVIREHVPSQVQHVRAEVGDPTTLTEDVVIGADGVRSRVRPLVAGGTARRRSSPFVTLRGMAPGEPPKGQDGEYWGPGFLFGIVPAAGGTYWFSGHPSAIGPEPLDATEVARDALTALPATAAPHLRERLGEVAEKAPRGVVATRLWSAPPLRRYVRGRYVVIGDAGHAMLPNLGRGACEAIIDAVTLAEALRDEELLRWQLRRLAPTQAMRIGAAAIMRGATSRRLTPAREAVLSGAGRVTGTR
ncbi:FAD-dependent monooxygenase [Marihabitans asiaticum]|uniref:2-polyprenyl-6-methoxyphenol hydroxylase-like FAD-dependent oxidoreductase n=1 Tax=Marihabitans asiaticum TaxID=415218 RepID=A0A560WF18_9MICO|nr:NAD(P)/FAD-dependent oxidoreductase [Marihabitans asiaticum]TWD16085.1 2-polyprenyl-6-methoxyphenol hydroxylase-like FAD-dependent oxidoreductase [Marihabitans asiaticum]